jgi:hypothetical protein
MLCGFENSHTTPTGAGPSGFIELRHDSFNFYGRRWVSPFFGLGLLFLASSLN